MPFINSNEKCAKLLCMSKKSSNFDLLPHKWGPLRIYFRVLPDIRKGGYFSSSLTAFVFCTHIYRLMQA